MEQKFESLKKENPEELTECFDFIKSSVKDGSYFKDGLNWYFFRYVNPFCDRTILTLASILSVIVCYCLFVLIEGAFPLVQKNPIFIPARDESLYFPNLIPLKPHPKGVGAEKYDPTIQTVDEAVAKYLLSIYIKDREGYDYSKSEIEDVNNKFNHIRNTSSDQQYREFQLYMSKDNPDSPIHNFGLDVAKNIEITGVTFPKVELKGFADKAKSFLSNKIPTAADVRFVATIKTKDENDNPQTKTENYLAKIEFDFSGAVKPDKDKPNSSKLNFIVNSYKLYKVQ